MQHSLPEGPGDEPDQLPAITEGGRVSALTVARNNQQQLALDLRTPAEPEDGEVEFHLIDYWRILVKRRWTVIAVTALVLMIGVVSTLMTTPLYRATATVEVEKTSLQVVQVGGVMNTQPYDPTFLQTQIELLRSHALSERVVQQLGLANAGELEKLAPGSPLQRVMAMIRGRPEGSHDPVDAPGAAGGASKERVASAAAVFRGGLAIQPVADSGLVAISYDSVDPLFSQRAANAVAEAFVAQNLERKFGSTAYAKSYLEDRLQELRLKLEESERQLVKFAKQEQIVSAGDASGANLMEQNLGSLNEAYAKAKEERIRTEARWQQAQALHGTGLQLTAENPMMKSLQESRAKLQLEYQDKLRLYKPDYPEMQQLKSQLDEIDKQITREEGNVRSGIQADYQAALQQENMLAKQLSLLKTDVLDLQDRSIQYNIYKREVDTNRQLYDAMLQRYKEIGIAGGVSANNLSLVDRADPGYKFKPDVRRNVTIALALGLILGCLLALAFEYLDDTIKRPDDIEKLLGLPVLGAVPLLKAPMTPTTAMQDSRSAFAEAYRSLRTALQFSTDRGAPRTLLITSATPHEGKSTTANVLGRHFAELGKRVLIVDCDLRNPSLHRAFGVENDQGLSNYLAGTMKPTDLIRTTAIPGLMYLPTGPLPPNPAELLMGSKMVTLLTVAAEKFDLLILDGPPIMGLADAPILANLAQATLLVVQAQQTRVGMARNAIKRLHSARARIVGGLLTHFQPEHAGQAYGYGYGGYDYYSYGSSRPRLTNK
jgi:succinoglycan biosynthesis transport protein ExoP